MTSTELRPIVAASIHHRFTYDDYRAMTEAGILTNHSRVELLDGQVVDMPQMRDDNIFAMMALDDILDEGLRGKARVANQIPLLFDEFNDLVPDFWVARPGASLRPRPKPADVLLVIEISSTSLPTDRGPKRDRYAAAGIAEYWIVNLLLRRIEVHREPHDGEYRSLTIVGVEEQVAPAAFPDLVVRVADLFDTGEVS